jgi:bifunctional UDP-N-acetylglucosamine pyrophosphorylase / glucosamine-1-phosphate N-acetyltransferase
MTLGDAVATNLTVIVLAAGSGTRMRSKTNKVLHRIGGRSMVQHVLTAVDELRPRNLVVVVGAQRDQVAPHIQESAPQCVLAVQAPQSGTGHAVQVAIETLLTGDAEALSGSTATVLIAAGDTPLLQGDTLHRFVEEHVASECAVSILSGVVADPTGYGRIVRTAAGDVLGIVEEKDADEQLREISEINSGILAFAADFLLEALPRLKNDNLSGEYYLTDLVSLARGAGLMVGAIPLPDTLQTHGANDRVQLAALGRELNRRILDRAMREGVTIIDPETTWIDADVQLGTDIVIHPGCQLLGDTVVGDDAVIGPDTTLQDCRIGPGASVVRSHCLRAQVDASATVGPFSFLRPGTLIGPEAKIGAFVETKNATLGKGAKVPHLSYVGDAEIGEGANIGAGTIFANYDGVNKHRSRVGVHARTASNNTFVAPVEIGDGAATGAGAVIRRDVPPGALGVSSGPQRNLVGWVARRWPGSAMARAAVSRAAATRNAPVGRSAPGAPQSGAPGQDTSD